jgi:hypothetical protein
MMGGAGAGRGGQGGEDDEHQRQFVQDTDEVFSLADDEILRDPVTGEVVAPPTIGELATVPVLTRPVTVPRALLLHVWNVEKLGETHPVLGGFELYLPQDNDKEFTRECLRVLADLGLADGEVLTRDFRLALRAIAAPDRQLYCWSAHADSSQDRKFFVGARGRDAVAMQVRGDTVSIVPVDERRLVEVFVAELPDFPAAPVRALTIAKQDFEAQDGRRDLFAARQSPARQLAQQMQERREAVHQIYTATTSGGRCTRSRQFSLIDLADQGRILAFLDGQDNLHRLPGTPANLARILAAT